MEFRHYIALVAILVIAGVIIYLIPAESEGYAYITDANVRALKVNSTHAELAFEIRISKKGDLDGANLKLRFFDAKTNLMLYEFSEKLNESEQDYITKTVKLSISKNKDYRVKIELEEDGKVFSMHNLNIFALSEIPPDDERLEINLKDADFILREKKDGVVRVEAIYYAESFEDYSNVKFRIKAVQLESNLLIDEFWDTRNLSAGKINLLRFNISLADGYNYRIVLEVWSNGHTVEKREDIVRLNPEGYREENKSEGGFRVEDFVREDIMRTPVPEIQQKTITSAPGFGILTTIIAGGAGIWIMRRKA